MVSGQSVLGTWVGLELTVVIVIANVVGAAVVLVLAAWVLPTGPMADPAGEHRARRRLRRRRGADRRALGMATVPPHAG